MVYCGKASQGCQSCRQRRIKCDKVKPECSQCIRIGKKCPGYRDQLSLMFRDESSKVIQKAHAQWGTTATSPMSTASASVASSSASWASSPSASGSDPRSPLADSPASQAEMVLSRNLEMLSPKIQSAVEPTLEQRGLQFFIEQYLMKSPDAPQAARHLAVYSGRSESLQTVMMAVGLAGLSNRKGDRSMNLVARQKYVTALKQTGRLVAMGPSDTMSVMGPLRTVVMLAMFELVQGRGSRLSTGTANIHIIGAIALLKNVVPKSPVPSAGAKAILQLMFSLFIPSQVTDTPISPQFFQVLALVRQLLHPRDHCCCDLAVATAKLLQILMTINPQLSQGQDQAENIFQQLLGMDAVMGRIEEQLRIALPFTVEEAPRDIPRQAVFRGKYHKYADIDAARVWNHLRWARILTIQRTVELSKDYPLAYSRVVSPAQADDCLATVRRMAEDTITSTPSHWHHPVLSDTQARAVAASGKGGTGAAGMPGLLWHLKIAGCAPGVPQDFWEWSYEVVQIVWKTMGMQHALALSEVMEGHRAGMEKEAIERLIKIEDEGGEW